MSNGRIPEPRRARVPDIIPPHIAGWQLPPDWRWGADGIYGDYRHYQQVVDALGRSLSLVTAPNPDHQEWLRTEATTLAHRSHPSIPAIYHFWALNSGVRRGPGYLRRWVTGETVRKRVNRMGEVEIPYVLQILRGAASTLSYLHDSGAAHGGVGPDTVWLAPGGRLWMLEWQWAIPHGAIPHGVTPSWLDGGTSDDAPAAGRRLIKPGMPIPPEWQGSAGWAPTPASDQWQIAAMCFTALTGETPPRSDIPPVKLVRAECPAGLATALDRALLPDPAERFPSVVAFLRTADQGFVSRSMIISASGGERLRDAGEEERLRWALGDDYEVLSQLGSGSFGTVWRARDLSLEREVAVKVLHPHVVRNDEAVAAFRREARIAAQLAHPAIIPIYDWDNRGDIAWYTMELAEGGSVCSLVDSSGPRSLHEIAPQVEMILEGLIAAHAAGIIHRDLKPENVLIDRNGRWRVTDFGIANIAGQTRAGASGTPAFAAPEQLLGETQTQAADIYSLAAIVAFVLLGHPPFGDDEATAILARQLTGAPQLEGLSPPIADWLRRALAPEVADRFPDAAEFRAGWRRAQAATKLATARASFWSRLRSRAFPNPWR